MAKHGGSARGALAARWRSAAALPRRHARLAQLAGGDIRRRLGGVAQAAAAA